MVNRGGAFEVSDGTFNFFLALEISVRHSLSVHLDSNSTSNVETVVEQVMAIKDIQFYWRMLSVDITDDLSHEVLRDIVKLWLTLFTEWIMGRVMKCGLRKLRKGLKKK